MNYETITLAPFNMMGIAVRTINKDGHSGRDIKALWDRLFAEQILEKIPNKVDDKIISAYCDYESDHLDYYICLLGCKVSEIGEVPEGLTGKTFEGGKYTRFDLHGPIPNIVLDGWTAIWEGGYDRAYTADFDVHEPMTDPSNAKASIYLGIH